ncbi:hypothetical protein [uncultured Roseibium sp.]|uniref:tetratricopeptide repeat protein n=1 Tax=uncultured Roseibium sp. TaxID=1936171 RepID=UPI002605C893|nr:hypothetical protein [uncultured Roseibium sp.]
MKILKPSISPTYITEEINYLSPAFRDPCRHGAQQGPNYKQKYDYLTVLFDIFYDDSGGILAIAPPLGRHVRKYGMKFLYTSGEECKFIHNRKTNLDFFKLSGDAKDKSVRLKSKLFDHTVSISQNESKFFENCRVLLFINKNNSIQWVHDFVKFYVKIHGADAVCLYDNGSTEYVIDDLLDALKDIQGLKKVAIVGWPFPWGVTDGNSDSSYTQRAFLEHARWRMLTKARSVLQCDVDELIFSERHRLFETVENSETGYIAIKGRWMTNQRREALQIIGPPRHHHFELTDLSEYGWCGKKWACVPRKITKHQQWMVHDIFGGKKVDQISSEFILRHFAGLNTGWKQANRSENVVSEVVFKEEKKITSVMQALFGNSVPKYLVEYLPNAAQLAFAAGRISASLRSELVEELYQRSFSHIWLAMLTARFYEKQKNDTRAKELYEHVISIDDTIYEAKHYLGFIYERQQNYEKAFNLAIDAASEMPSEKKYTQRLLNLGHKLREYDEIRAILESIRVEFPDDKWILLELAKIYARKEGAECALELIRNNVDDVADLETLDHRLYLADLYLKCDCFVEALTIVERALYEDEKKPWTHYLRSRCHENLGNKEEAIEAIKTALSFSPGNKVFLQFYSTISN